MKKLFNPKLNCNTYELMAGEYYATSEPDVALITLLGSCIAACFIDEENGVIGMNHFMLPGKFHHDKPIPVNDPRYGTCAIDMLVREMINSGARRQNLKAKVFGAGNVVENISDDIAGSNAEFTKKYLHVLRIPVIAEDLGGNCGRKLFFFSHSREVFLKRIADFSSIPQAVEKEKKFSNWLQENCH